MGEEEWYWSYILYCGSVAVLSGWVVDQHGSGGMEVPTSLGSQLSITDQFYHLRRRAWSSHRWSWLGKDPYLLSDWIRMTTWWGKFFLTCKMSTVVDPLTGQTSLGMKIHTKRVMGMSFDVEQGHLYSVGKDQFLKVTDTSNKSPICELPVGTRGLHCLCHDTKYGRLFMGDGDGQIHIYSCKSMPPTHLGSVATNPRSVLWSIQLSGDCFNLYTTNMKGFVYIFQLGAPGKEWFIKQLSEMKGAGKVWALIYSEDRNEIITGTESGNVTFWNAKTSEPLSVLEAHSDDITSMAYFPKSRYLFTGSKDKHLWIW